VPSNVCQCKDVANSKKIEICFISIDLKIKRGIKKDERWGITGQVGQNGTKQLERPVALSKLQPHPMSQG
jgi:hypothetical protein